MYIFSFQKQRVYSHLRPQQLILGKRMNMNCYQKLVNKFENHHVLECTLKNVPLF